MLYFNMLRNLLFYIGEQITFFILQNVYMRFFIFFLMFSGSILAQTEYPKDYFSPSFDIYGAVRQFGD
jgi:hypothetical protein